MSKAVELVLPWMPSVNHMYVNINYNGRLMRIIGKEGKAYLRAVAEILIDADNPRLEGDLVVDSLVLHPPTSGRRDLDNCLKCLWDSLQDRNEKVKGGGKVLVRRLFSGG